MMPDKTLSILIIDDTPANIAVLFETLEKANYRPLIAQDGASAIQQALKAQPALIFLDVQMPGMDGFETCRRLKQNPQTAAIPVIFLTVSDDVADKVKGFDVGGVDYLTKPIIPTEVLARLNTHLRIRNLESQLKTQNEQLSMRVQDYLRDLQAETEKRRLYQREREDLLNNVAQQSNALQKLTAHIMADHKQQNQLMGQSLQHDILSDLDKLQEVLLFLQDQLQHPPPDTPTSETLLPQVETGLDLMDQVQASLHRLIARLNPTSPATPETWQTPLENLSKRERQVLTLVAQSQSNKEIANRLKISPKTVSVYRWRIMQKLAVDNVPDLIKLALKYNLIDLSS